MIYELILIPYKIIYNLGQPHRLMVQLFLIWVIPLGLVWFAERLFH
jgi:hypothetical protein